MSAVLIIKRDGVEVARVEDSEFAVLQWFHRHCSGSMDWAIKHEGYTVEDEKGRELYGRNQARSLADRA